MSDSTAFVGARIFDGEEWHEEAALLVSGTRCDGIVARKSVPADAHIRPVDGTTIVPGFVDMQVNGGGGAMFNADPSVETIATICAAHARFGTTALLVTLISDTPDTTKKAIAAAVKAGERCVPGFAGLHLEGPHLAPARKGAHDKRHFRSMQDDDLQVLVDARKRLPALMTTVAPEAVSREQVRAMADAGIVVSLGHSDIDCRTAMDYAAAGASMTTHLFNAMSPLAHREPGLVGAALATPSLSASLIADGFHVDPVAIAIAMRAKTGPGRLCLITDSMAPLGTSTDRFELNGRVIKRAGGRLTLEDGTLAGADIDMAGSVRFMHDAVGTSPAEALRMAGLYPAEVLGLSARKGRLTQGHDADFAVMDESGTVTATAIGGEFVFKA